MERCDIVVVGGGIVGLATARSLVRRKRFSVTVLEAETEIARHQTGHNSGVVHSGLYYKPGSLKAENCTRGREAIFRYCQERGVAFERCGKLVVATRRGEFAMLEELERRGTENGLEGIERLGPDGIREREPHAAGIAALWVPDTGIVDYSAVAAAFAAEIEEGGGRVITSACVREVREESGQLLVLAGDTETTCGHLVNCAGLSSDRLARLCGLEPGLRIVPFRGEYYELTEARSSLVRNLIYPVPDPSLPFLGVHFTRTIDGRVEAGPNAVLALTRDGYDRLSFSLRDTLDSLTYSGFWKLAARYPRTAAAEVLRTASKRAFVASLRKLVPEIRPADVSRSGSGVRAQAVLPSGDLVDDFRILDGERSTHVLNAPSPAATASLAIGEALAQRFYSKLRP